MPRRRSGDSSAGVAVIFSGQACECCEGFLFKCCESSQTRELQFHTHLMGFTPQSRPFTLWLQQEVQRCSLSAAKLSSFLFGSRKQATFFISQDGLYVFSLLVAKCGIAREKISDGSGWWGFSDWSTDDLPLQSSVMSDWLELHLQTVTSVWIH